MKKNNIDFSLLPSNWIFIMQTTPKIRRLSCRALKRLHSQQNPKLQLQRSSRYMEKRRKMSWDYPHFGAEQVDYSAREVTILISLLLWFYPIQIDG